MKYILRSGMSDTASGGIPKQLDDLLAANISDSCRARALAMAETFRNGEMPSGEDLYWLSNAKSDPGCYNSGVGTPPITDPTPSTPTTPNTDAPTGKMLGVPWWVWVVGGLGVIWVASD